jgi:hypothetical protein
VSSCCHVLATSPTPIRIHPGRLNHAKAR